MEFSFINMIKKISIIFFLMMNIKNLWVIRICLFVYFCKHTANTRHDLVASNEEVFRPIGP